MSPRAVHTSEGENFASESLFQLGVKVAALGQEMSAGRVEEARAQAKPGEASQEQEESSMRVGNIIGTRARRRIGLLSGCLTAW